MRYSLPHLVLEQKYVVRCRPQALALNCNSTRLSIIDINGVLTLFDLDARAEGAKGALGVHLKLERKDAWDMLWSDDNPELFACMEKTRMYIFRGLNPEEPVSSNGYLCSFTDLCVRSVLMDDVMKSPEAPVKEQMLLFETKSLRDTRDLLATTPIQEAYQFCDDNPHPRLWRLIAEAALEQLNFLVADKAFVRCHDFQGIQFVKRLKLLTERNKQKAEVASYFRRFDEAEGILLKADAKDLAVELRMRLGDWFRVVQLIQSGGGGDDQVLAQAYSSIGDYYADRQKWDKAFLFYTKAKNTKALVQCSYVLEDYMALEKYTHQLPDGSPLLFEIGEKLMSVGLSSEAVHAFLKSGNVKAAIDCCVLLNQWDSAVELAEAHNFPQIEGLLAKYASYLLEKNKTFQAIDLYRKANRFTDAARLLSKLAQTAAAGRGDPLRAKRLYVLAALHVDQCVTFVFVIFQQHLLSLVSDNDDNVSTYLFVSCWCACIRHLCATHSQVHDLMLDDVPDCHPSLPLPLPLCSHRFRSRILETSMLATGATAAGGGAGVKGSQVLGSQMMKGSASTVATMNALLAHDTATGQDKSLDLAWRGAEAFHFFMLAQRQLGAGAVDAAMKTSLRLIDYDDIIDAKEIYSLIALTAVYNKFYGQASRAFIKLESLDGASAEELDKYQTLAIKIFMKNRPEDPATRDLKCPSAKCNAKIKDWHSQCPDCGDVFPACVVTGRSIIGPEYTMCRVCKHKAYTRELKQINNCPLCHHPVRK